MKIDKLYKNNMEDIGIGSVLIFTNGETTDPYILAWDRERGLIVMISLKDFHIVDEWSNMKETLKKIQSNMNGFTLSQVIPFNELELSRVQNER